MWVFLAFASIETRRGALLMIWGSVLFSIYCLPWSRFIKDVGWIQKVFLFHGWFWFVVMAAITLWYWMAFIWIDRHDAWPKPITEPEKQPHVEQADES